MGTKRNAVAYLRTSSASNVGEDKDSADRQRAAITSYAKRHRIEVVKEFYDAAVSGADPIADRPGFSKALAWIAENEPDAILVESPDRFARDLTVQLVGHDMLKGLGIDLIPTSAPDHFTDETPTAVMVRQILGAVSEFQKAELVSKLKAARERTGRLGGPDRYPPEVVRAAKRLSKQKLSLRRIGNKLAEQGHLNANRKPYAAQSIKNMLAA
ncbi:MAG: recombinase family protein [Pseudomonadota bacterium]|nr:recombinase family protein [Pseudomonadota bacterium]